MNSLSIRVQPKRPTTSRAISDPPDAYWRVIVTSGFTADEGCVGDLRCSASECRPGWAPGSRGVQDQRLARPWRLPDVNGDYVNRLGPAPGPPPAGPFPKGGFCSARART